MIDQIYVTKKGASTLIFYGIPKFSIEITLVEKGFNQVGILSHSSLVTPLLAQSLHLSPFFLPLSKSLTHDPNHKVKQRCWRTNTCPSTKLPYSTSRVFIFSCLRKVVLPSEVLIILLIAKILSLITITQRILPISSASFAIWIRLHELLEPMMLHLFIWTFLLHGQLFFAAFNLFLHDVSLFSLLTK